MGRSLPLDNAKSLAVRLERLFHRMGALGKACEAVDDNQQKNALAVTVADVQALISGMIDDLNLLYETPDAAFTRDCSVSSNNAHTATPA